MGQPIKHYTAGDLTSDRRLTSPASRRRRWPFHPAIPATSHHATGYNEELGSVRSDRRSRCRLPIQCTLHRTVHSSSHRAAERGGNTPPRNTHDRRRIWLVTRGWRDVTVTSLTECQRALTVKTVTAFQNVHHRPQRLTDHVRPRLGGVTVIWSWKEWVEQWSCWRWK